MSRVTLIDIYNERFNEPSLKLSATADIEVVPRKIVEMIIAECNSQISAFHHSPSIVNTVAYIKEYAESLLKQFEEEK
jgi:hypothetical protein